MPKIRKKTFEPYKGKVYDLNVDNSHTYNVENVAVHNSGAGSLLNYVLGITNLDPLHYDLLFGRFINPYRKGLPDIDSDVADRDLLLGLLREEFGEESIVPITNHNTLQLKSLIKDISRFYGIPFEEVNKATLGLEREIMRKVLGKGDDKNLFQLKFEDCMKHSTKFKAFMDKYPQVEVHVENLLGQLKSCVTGDTKVLTAGGYKQIRDLCPGVDAVAYHDAEHSVSFNDNFSLIHQGKKIVFELELEDGKTLKLTGDHKVKTARGYIEVSELCEDDVVFVK